MTINFHEGNSEALLEQVKALDGIVKQCAGVLNTFMPKLEDCINEQSELKARLEKLEMMLMTGTNG